MRRLIVALVGVLVCAACSVRQPVNPPRLVTDSQTDMSIQLFMQATILLSHYYGYSTIEYADFQQKTVRAGFSAVPFMPPESVRATPELINLRFDPTDPGSFRVFLDRTGYKLLSKYYITTGLRASQLICRNYLLGLDEKNQYLEFLRREFGVAYGLASGILALANANGTITNSFFLASTAINNGLTAYEEYRFLNIDREAARVLVDAAMNKYAEYFIGQVDRPPNGVMYTFSDALNAVSVIEYQCTREGIRNLLNRSVNNTPTNLTIDANTGTVAFFSSQNVVETHAPSFVVPERGGSPKTPSGGQGGAKIGGAGGGGAPKGGPSGGNGDVATLQRIDLQLKDHDQTILSLTKVLQNTSAQGFGAKTVVSTSKQITNELDEIAGVVRLAIGLNRTSAMRSGYDAVLAALKADSDTIAALRDQVDHPADPAHFTLTSVIDFSTQIVNQANDARQQIKQALALNLKAESGP